MSFLAQVQKKYTLCSASLVTDLKKEFKKTGWNEFTEDLALSDEWGDGDAPLTDDERADEQQYHLRFSSFLKDIQKNLKMSGNNLILYRAINLENKHLWLKNLEDDGEVGVSWSYKKSGAVAYHGEYATTYILKAIVPLKSVSLDETIGLNISFNGSEAEIRLKKGAPLTIVEISKGRRSEKVQLKSFA